MPKLARLRALIRGLSSSPAALVATALGFVATPPGVSHASTSGVVISAVYGGGGNANATYTHDYIELFNAGVTPASLNGWSLQYASATGTGNLGANATQLTVLPDVVLVPGQYYLVQEASTAAVGSPLPAPDLVAASPINMSGTAGKVALVAGNTTLGCNGGSAPCSPAALALIVDLVGYGNANFFEGAVAPTLSSTTAAGRNGNGCTDTDNNAADFTVGAPVPRNSISPLNLCVGGDTAPGVISTSPADGGQGVAESANVVVNFSENVNVTGSWFVIGCTISGSHAAAVSGGPSSFTLDPDTNFAGGETCTVSVFAAQVTDQDLVDPPDAMAADYVFDFDVVAGCGSPADPIHAVQGSGPSSPLVGQAVTIEGVVVGDFQGGASLGGFFVQEEDADADLDPSTSEGIFVFSALPVSAGDRVRVSGTVLEFNELTELSPVSSVTTCAVGQSVTPASVTLPFASSDDAERYEGMAVVLPQTLTVSETFDLARFGEVTLSSGGRLLNPTNVVAPGAPAVAMQAANDLNRIVLDDASNVQNPDPTPFMFDEPNTQGVDPTLRVGDTVSGLSGVMHFGFGDYRVEPVPAPAFVAANPRPTAAPNVGGTLKLAAANVLNYFNGDGAGGGFPTSRGAETPAEFARQRAKTIASLGTLNADVLGLMEMENDSTASEYSAVEDLVDGLNAVAGAGNYAFIDTGVIGTDQIRVALLYKPATVTPVGATGVLLTGSFNGFSRPPIAQAFEENATGARFVVVINHFKSKGCGGAVGADLDQGDGQSCYNATRVQSANELMAWLATDPTGTGDPDVVILGDLNAYLQEDPVTTLEVGGYTNLVESRLGTDAHSFVFQAQSGALDNALASSGFAAAVTGVAEWHTNADEPNVLDYNTNFKSVAQQALEVGTPYRAADHDALLIGLQFASEAELEDGGMEVDEDRDRLPDGWTGDGLLLHPLLDGQDCRVALGGDCSFRLRPSLWPKRLAQVVPLAGRAGDVLSLTYSIKTQLVTALVLGRARLVFQRANGRTDAFERNLPVGTRDWASFTLNATAPRDYVGVRVEFISQRLLGTTWIDEVNLTRD